MCSALRMLSDKGTMIYTRSHRPSPTQLSAHAPRSKNTLQVRRLVAALRPVGRAAQRDAQPAVSCVALTEAVASGPEGRAAFLDADGAAALLELLGSRNAEVRNRAGIAASNAVFHRILVIHGHWDLSSFVQASSRCRWQKRCCSYLAT